MDNKIFTSDEKQNLADNLTSIMRDLNFEKKQTFAKHLGITVQQLSFIMNPGKQKANRDNINAITQVCKNLDVSVLDLCSKNFTKKGGAGVNVSEQRRQNLPRVKLLEAALELGDWEDVAVQCEKMAEEARELASFQPRAGGKKKIGNS